MKLALNVARKHAKMSVNEVAKKLNLCEATIYRWEGYLASPTIDKAKALCDMYGLSLDDIAWYEGEK